VHRNCYTLLHRRPSVVDRALQQSSSSHRSIASYSSTIAICACPTCIRRSHWGASEYRRDIWYETTRMVSYPMVKKFKHMFIHFDIMYTTDRQTDRRTDRHTRHDGIGSAFAPFLQLLCTTLCTGCHGITSASSLFQMSRKRASASKWRLA